MPFRDVLSASFPKWHCIMPSMKQGFWHINPLIYRSLKGQPLQLQLHFVFITPACACAAGVKQCLLVCVCACVCVCVSAKNIEKCFKQGHKGVYRRHSQRNSKTIRIIILGHFCTWYKSRRFFSPLFHWATSYYRFVAPPLSKTHVVVTGQRKSIWQRRTERCARDKYSMNTL